MDVLTASSSTTTMPQLRSSRKVIPSDSDHSAASDLSASSEVEEVSGQLEASDSVIGVEDSGSDDDDGNNGGDDDDAGSRDLVLPLRFDDDLEVLSLGSLKHQHFHSTACLFPTDYSARKLHTSYKNPAQQTWYHCSIADKHNRPVFVVSTEDDPVRGWVGGTAGCPRESAVSNPSISSLTPKKTFPLVMLCGSL